LDLCSTFEAYVQGLGQKFAFKLVKRRMLVEALMVHNAGLITVD
jgi:hypothetical protein